MEANFPVVSPDVSVYGQSFFENALAPDGPLASLPLGGESDNSRDLWQEGYILGSDDHDIAFDPQELFISPGEHLTSDYPIDSDSQNSGNQPWYETDRDTVRAWEEFKCKHGFECAFQPLRGTHRARYATVTEKRNQSLKTIEELCQAVARTSNKRQEQPREERRFVAEGRKQIKRYEKHRAACLSKPKIESHFTTVWVSGQEVKVKLTLLDSQPFMGYLPGDYLMRHIQPVNQNNLSTEGITQEEYAAWNNQDCLVTEGIVPYTQEECVDRLVGDVVPAILDMLIAFVAFDPSDVSRMPQWGADLREKSISALTSDDMRILQDKWMQKFKWGLPHVLQLQYSDSESKFWEAAWLLEQVKKFGVVYPWSIGFTYLLHWPSDRFADDLAGRYTSIVLHREALECIAAEESNSVLAYQISPFAQKADIHDFYQGHGALINRHAPSPQRLADIRNTAEKLLLQQRLVDRHRSDTHNDPSKDGKTTVHAEPPATEKVTHQLPAQPGNTADAITAAPTAEPAATVSTATSNKRKRAETLTEASPSPHESHLVSSTSSESSLPSDQPAPIKRGRGRPKKKAGDPKSPYRRKKPVSERSQNKRQKLEKDKSAKESN